MTETCNDGGPARGRVGGQSYITPNRANTSLKTPSGSFSELFAASQGYINQQFETLFALDEGPPQKADYKSARYGSIESELVAPQVALNVEISQLPLWYMNFGETGTASVWSDTKNDFVSYPTKDWVFVFNVNLGKVNIKQDTEEFKTITAAVGAKDPNDFSLTRLIMDFSTAQADSANIALCKFPGVDVTPDFSSNIKILMSAWIAKAMTDASGTIGYYWGTTDPTKDFVNVPTFPPTSTMYQGYPYYETASSIPVQSLDKVSNNNTLLYLQMTQQLPFPIEKYLAFRDNWVEPPNSATKSKGVPATMCIGKAIFFDSYLLRKYTVDDALLTAMNYATYLECPDIDANGYPYKLPNKEASFYSWSPAPDGTGWVWEPPKYANSYTGNVVKSKTTLTVKNKITVHPLTNQITVSGSTVVYAWQYIKSDPKVPALEGDATSTTTWTINMTLDSILAGGLKINMNLPDSGKDVFTTTTKTSGDGKRSVFDIGKNVSADIQTAATSSQSDWWTVASNLQASLNKASKFYFPGAGSFLYQDPQFNNEWDVLVNIHYDAGTDFLGRKPKKHGHHHHKSG